MLEWLSVVRLADLDGIRHALTGLGEGGTPIILRRAQKWVKRMVDIGLVGRAPMTSKDGSVVWVTWRWAGRKALNPFAQTARHQIAVALVSARYLAQGYTWCRDAEDGLPLTHQADGVAVHGDRKVLVEVELTQKQRARYRGIFLSHVSRFERGDITHVAYYATDSVARALAREVDRYVHTTMQPELSIHATFDLRGRWISQSAAGIMDRKHVAMGARRPIITGTARGIRVEARHGEH